MRMSGSKVVQDVGSSLWLIPVLCVLLGMVISFATIAVDRATDYQLLPASVVGGPDAALEILTTVATSMVNLAALVLTIVLVVVQLAMGQFSPRIVQRLLRDRPSQLAIGLFVATFVHTLLTIREVDPGDPGETGQVPGLAIVVTFLLSLASIAVLVMYIHHIGQALRVSALVEIAGANTRRLVDKMYPDKGTSADPAADALHVAAPTSGVVTMIDRPTLISTAQDADCVLELIPALGEFIPAGAYLFRIDGGPSDLNHDTVRASVILRLERTLDEDVAYGLRLLVDIGLRSLADSPLQDPTTAVQAIDRLHDCLRELIRRPLPDGRHYDDAGNLRLIEPVMSWDDYLLLAVVELRLAGAGSPQVTRRLQAALKDLQTIAPPERRDVLAQQLKLLSATANNDYANQQDTALAQVADGMGLGTQNTNR